jgi:hypothetical protein
LVVEANCAFNGKRHFGFLLAFANGRDGGKHGFNFAPAEGGLIVAATVEARKS